MAGGKRKFTPEEREQIRQLLAQGVSVTEVARQFGADPRRIGGFLSTWRNQGILPAAVGDGNSWHPAPTTSFSPMAPPTPPPAESAPPLDETWETSPTGHYEIERTYPNDGYLGIFCGLRNFRDFAWLFGGGRYSISFYQPGYRTYTFVRDVDKWWFLEPRFPPPCTCYEDEGMGPSPEESW